MSGKDSALLDDVIVVPAPLSMRLWHGSFDTLRRVIIDGPPGAVELQNHPDSLGHLGGTMSIVYHSRRPTFGADTALPDCEVLGGAACYTDSLALGAQDLFHKWFRARDGKAIVDELAHLHHARWPRGKDQTAAAPSVNSSSLHRGARRGRPGTDDARREARPPRA